MNMLRFIAIATLASAALRPNVASADTIVQFENDAALVGDVSINAASSHADVSSSALANGAGLDAWGWPNAASPLGFFGNTSLSDAIANDDYLSLTLTPDAGHEIDFDNLFVRIGVNVGGTVGENEIDLLSSLTGFTAADSLDTFQPITDSGVAVSTFNTDLTGITALQDVTAPVEFRLYMSDIANRIAIGNPFATDGATDLQFDGTVSPVTAVPEPGLSTVLTLSCAAFLFRRRRTRDETSDSDVRC